MTLGVLVLIALLVGGASCQELNLTHLYRARCPPVTGNSDSARLALHNHFMYLLGEAADPTGPENLKPMLSLQFQTQFNLEYGANSLTCRTIGHDCSWRHPNPLTSTGIYQCVYGPDWCGLLTEEGAERCGKEAECFWSLPNPFYGSETASCAYHKDPGVQPNGQSTLSRDPWWDRSKLAKVSCTTEDQCKLRESEHDLNAASTYERMNSDKVVDTYGNAVRHSLGWLHAYDQAAKGSAQVARYEKGVEQSTVPPGICDL